MGRGISPNTVTTNLGKALWEESRTGSSVLLPLKKNARSPQRHTSVPIHSRCPCTLDPYAPFLKRSGGPPSTGGCVPRSACLKGPARGQSQTFCLVNREPNFKGPCKAQANGAESPAEAFRLFSEPWGNAAACPQGHQAGKRGCRSLL